MTGTQVKENSVNVIFAVTEEQFDVYNLLQANVEGSSAGRFFSSCKLKMNIRYQAQDA